MGLFFKTRENANRTKLSAVHNTIVALVMLILIVLAIFDGLDSFYLKLVFIVAGISSIIDGVVSYRLRENRSVYLLDFGYALLWFVLSFLYSS